MRLASLMAACACLLLLLPGCTKRLGLKPEGKILKNGVPFVPREGEFVQVSFVSTGEAGSYVASFKPEDSTFVITDGNGMPRGQYKVTIQVLKKHKDTLEGKASPTKSPFVFDIQTGKEEIKVDLATLEPQKIAPVRRGPRA